MRFARRQRRLPSRLTLLLALSNSLKLQVAPLALIDPVDLIFLRALNQGSRFGCALRVARQGTESVHHLDAALILERDEKKRWAIRIAAFSHLAFCSMGSKNRPADYGLNAAGCSSCVVMVAICRDRSALMRL